VANVGEVVVPAEMPDVSGVLNLYQVMDVDLSTPTSRHPDRTPSSDPVLVGEYVEDSLVAWKVVLPWHGRETTSTDKDHSRVLRSPTWQIVMYVRQKIGDRGRSFKFRNVDLVELLDLSLDDRAG